MLRVQEQRRSCVEYQRDHRKDITDEERKAFEVLWARDAGAGEYVVKDNPPELKRKNLIDFAQFVRVRGEKAYKSRTEADAPMTHAAFLIWAVQVQGFSSEEADDWWQELKNDRNIDRDSNGPRGRFQLYIPSVERRIVRGREQYEDNQAVEGNNKNKKPPEEYRAMLERNVLRQGVSFGDGFLSMSSKGAIVGMKRQMDEEAIGVDEGDGNKRGRARKRTAAFDAAGGEDISSAKTKAFARYEKEVGVASAKLLDATKKGKSAASTLLEHRVTLGCCSSSTRFARGLIEVARRLSGADVGLVIAKWSSRGSGDAASASRVSEAELSTERVAEIQGMTTRDFLQAEEFQRFAFWAPDQLQEFQQCDLLDSPMDELDLASLFEMSGPAFREYTSKVEAVLAVARMTAAGIAKTAAEMAAHIRSKAGQAQKGRRKKGQEAARAEIAAIRQRAQEAARAVASARARGRSGPTRSIFTAEHALAEMVEAVKWTGQFDVDTPSALELPDAVQRALADADFLQTSAVFAAQCKRIESVASTGLGQSQLTDKCKQAVSAAMVSMAPLGAKLDLSVASIPGGDQFEAQSWLFGLSPQMRRVVFTPNYAVDFMLKAVPEVFPGVAAEQELTESVSKLTNIRPLVDAGVRMWRQTLQPGAALCIPMGFICVEVASEQRQVHYGVRKSWFTHTAARIKHYLQILGMMKIGPAGDGRMENILRAMRGAAAAARSAAPEPLTPVKKEQWDVMSAKLGELVDLTAAEPISVADDYL
ncbi:unnamed protein product [Prorocentrum cordatum]|uniref:Uncharacterized protein n=1 Tax=Prorocentrum cordatum TaxID=2364126 RepID=A0ABN9TGM3_9DINO|nr:unnamed protein product [Polarella glacialis]